MLNRAGFSLVELVVALTLAALVLGSATTSLLHQQHAHLTIRAAASSDLQRRAALEVLAGQLAFLDAAAGDLTATQATDSAIQLRAPIAASIACTTAAGTVVLAPEADAPAAFGGSASAPTAGDTLWWLPDSTWISDEITSATTTASTCPLLGNAQSSSTVRTRRRDTIAAGSPLRVTRQTRYALYKSGDGSWQLGLREWSPSANSFAAPQPVAGPFLQKVSGRRSGFRYFDLAGTELGPAGGAVDVGKVARIRITAYSLLEQRDRRSDSIRTDSIDVALGHAHGP